MVFEKNAFSGYFTYDYTCMIVGFPFPLSFLTSPDLLVIGRSARTLPISQNLFGVV